MVEENVKGSEETQKGKSSEYDFTRETGVVLERIYSEVKAIGEGVKGLETKMDHRFDGIDQRIDHVESDLTMAIQVVDSNLRKEIRKVNVDLSAKIEKVDSKVDVVTNAVMDIKEEVKKHDQKLSHL